MAGRNYQLAEVTTYSFCSMQYHLRFGLGLPWVPASPESAFSFVAREATREYLRSLYVPTMRQHAQRNSVAVLDSGMRILSSLFPKAVVLTRRVEHLMAMMRMGELFTSGVDTPIGFDIPAEAVVKNGLEDVIVVKGRLDFAFWKNAGTDSERAVVVSVVGDDDPLEDYVNLESLRAGFAVQAMRDGKHYDVVVEHQVVPVFNRDRLPKRQVSSQRTANFQSVVRAVDRGIRARVFIPQSSPTKCQHCPYSQICSASLAERETADGICFAPENPFRNWPVRTA